MSNSQPAHAPNQLSKPILPTAKKSRLNPIWQARLNRFRHNRLGVISLIIFVLVFVVCMAANVIANDKPLLVQYDGSYYFPVVKGYPETTFGGILKLKPIIKTLSYNSLLMLRAIM